MTTFTPSNAIDMSKERDWAANLGMMDWDNTSIVFTKRSLIEFLKYTGVTVDTNYTNIQKLPRYAKFGKLTEPEATADSNQDSTAQTASSSASTEDASNGFKPSRRFRTAPGGETHDIFTHHVDDDALASAPPRPSAAAPNETARTGRATSGNSFWDEPEPEKPVFKPSRRVRDAPGGRDSVADLL